MNREFIDESIIKLGSPIDVQPGELSSFAGRADGLEVAEATQDEWDAAVGKCGCKVCVTL